MIKLYSNSKDGNKKLSENFKVKEFACKDGSDYILIDDDLVSVLQLIRSYFHSPVYINSAYRTQNWNEKVGGSKSSYHMFGMAADIHIKGVKSSELYSYLDVVFPETYGLILYDNFVHIDIRQKKYRKK